MSVKKMERTPVVMTKLGLSLVVYGKGGGGGGGDRAVT